MLCRGHSKHAFVNFHCSSDARRAFDGLHGKKFEGVEIKLGFAGGKSSDSLYLRGKNLCHLNSLDVAQYFSPICSLSEDKVMFDRDGVLAVVSFPSSNLAKQALSRLGNVVQVKGLALGMGYYAQGMSVVAGGHLSVVGERKDSEPNNYQDAAAMSNDRAIESQSNKKRKAVTDRLEDFRQAESAVVADPRQDHTTLGETGSNNQQDDDLVEDLAATPFLLISNLADDATVEELVLLVLKYSGCLYITADSVVLPSVHKNKGAIK